LARQAAKPLGSEARTAEVPKRNRKPNGDRNLGPGSGAPFGVLAFLPEVGLCSY
jgi:hypothetical protein